MAPTIHSFALVKTADGTLLTVAPEYTQALDAMEPYGYSRDHGRAIVIDGRAYLLREDCPHDGVGAWSPDGVEERETALDAAIAAMSADVRKRLGVTDHKPYAERKAQRAADDAEAAVRALEARGAKGAELAQARSKADEKRAALDDARGRKP